MSDPQVLNQPLVNKSDTVTPPDMGEMEPATGFNKSVILTGRNPTNDIAQRLPEAVNPKIVVTTPGAPGSDYGPQPEVIPMPGS